MRKLERIAHAAFFKYHNPEQIDRDADPSVVTKTTSSRTVELPPRMVDLGSPATVFKSSSVLSEDTIPISVALPSPDQGHDVTTLSHSGSRGTLETNVADDSDMENQPTAGWDHLMTQMGMDYF